MEEKILNTTNQSKVEGFASLTDPNGVFSLTTTFNDSSLNIGNEEVILPSTSISKVDLSENRKKTDGMEGIEGELLLSREVDVNLEVDVTGEASLTDENIEDYYIDGNSELIFIYKK